MRLSAVIRKEADLYVAWCPELDVASQGTDVESSLANLREAVELYLDDAEAVAPGEPALFTTFEVEDGAASGRIGT
ncbi:MAG TPA: type II toxin-antitoxin system HicB family antitoxin [Candidatus Thermoplasmatota archaeon]|nr:type II toxin-antitoxin system HicB family antitoxin [Candidatus Thermoplasmatota archaeon]